MQAKPKTSRAVAVNASARESSTYAQARAFQLFLGKSHHVRDFERGKGYQHTTATAAGGIQVLFDGSSEMTGTGTYGETEQKRKIAVCREMYENVGIVGNMVDIMVDFALEAITIEHNSQRIKSFYASWARQVDLFGFCESFLKCYYRDGNVPIFKIKAKVPESTLDTLRQRVRSEEKLTRRRALAQYFEDDPSPLKGRIPIRYRILDVLSLTRGGSDFLGSTSYSYKIMRDEVAVLKDPKMAGEIVARDRLVESMGQEAFDKLLATGKVTIPPDRLAVVFYKKDQWRKWATPMLWRISDDVKFKKLLRDADISLAEGVTNALIVVKLGRSEKGFHPSKKAYRKMVDMMKNPTKSKTIVWNDLIDIQQVYPPIEKMLSKDKYQQVNDDIRSGVGMPGVLLAGEGGGFSDSFLSVKGLMERLETGRQILLALIRGEFEDIANAMGFQRPAMLKMKDMSLSDQEVERRFLLELVDRNVISARTLVERADEDFDIELQRMKNEDALRKELSKDNPYTLRKLGKFGPQIQGASLAELVLTEDGTMISDPNTMPSLKSPKKGKGLPSGQEQNGPKGGRPPGVKRTRQETGPKKPVGASDALAAAVNAVDDKRAALFQVSALYDFLSLSVMKSKGYQGLNEIKSMEVYRIYDAIIKVMAHLDGSKRISKRQIAEVIRGMYVTDAGAKLERCVKSVVQQRVTKFRKDNGKAPDAEKMKDITSSAWAVCKSQGLK